ncbi:MAG: HEPN domain-containing protein [Chloroflexi bacterium]|nr:HEPN domain-containing protein [Chloroflexota bacterium]
MRQAGPFRHACFLAQQSAEKAIKTALVFLRIDFPWRHDLDALRNLLPSEWRVTVDHPRLAGLSIWAMRARYPGSWPEATETDAREAVTQARAVWQSVCRDLGEHGLDPEAGR